MKKNYGLLAVTCISLFLAQEGLAVPGVNPAAMKKATYVRDAWAGAKLGNDSCMSRTGKSHAEQYQEAKDALSVSGSRVEDEGEKLKKVVNKMASCYNSKNPKYIVELKEHLSGDDQDYYLRKWKDPLPATAK